MPRESFNTGRDMRRSKGGGDGQDELTATQCREQADQCRALAKQGMTEVHAVTLRHIAETWDRIAADIERRQ